MKKQEEEKFEAPKISDDEIKDFERELGNYQQSNLFSLAEGRESGFYGLSLKNQKDFSGYVLNDLLGAVHFSVVKYCLDNEIIRRRKNGSFGWLVALEDYKDRYSEYTRILDCSYKYFMPKWEGLRDLKRRRLYAKDQESESLGMPYRDRIRKILDENKLYEKKNE